MSEPQRYRKKPVIIEAMRWDGSIESAIAIIEWAHRHDVLSLNIREYEPGEDDTTHIMVHTREGVVRAEPGDYIVLESHPTEGRKFHPCKPDIFEATYEPAETSASRTIPWPPSGELVETVASMLEATDGGDYDAIARAVLDAIGGAGDE